MDDTEVTEPIANNDTGLRSIIRRASITYIECDDDNNDINEEENKETNNETTEQISDDVEEEKYNGYQLKLLSHDGISCIVDRQIADISEVIKCESYKTAKLVPPNAIIIMITKHWLKSLDIVVYSDEVIQIIIEYYPFCVEVNIMNEVRGSILKRIVTYMDHHHVCGAKEIEKPLRSADMRQIVSEWEADFIEVDQETLFEIILAANHLKIRPLLDLACAKVASMIKGKSPEEIRQRFNIENDFTPEEEEAVRAENAWAEDS